MAEEDFREVISALESDQEYRVGDLREDLGEISTCSLLEASRINDEDSEVIANEFSLIRTYHDNIESEKYMDRSTRLNQGLAITGVIGTVGSAAMLVRSGDPSYLATGLLSAGIGTYGAKNLKVQNLTEEKEEKNKEILDYIGLDDYEVKIPDSCNIEEIFRKKEESQNDTKAYTAEELDEMSDEEILKGK
jgi:hypothetical protein